MVKINSCPYCGSDMVYPFRNTNSNKYQVVCIKCTRRSKEMNSQEEAIEVWNNIKELDL